MTTQPSNDATRRNLSPEQMDNARHWIRMQWLANWGQLLAIHSNFQKRDGISYESGKIWLEFLNRWPPDLGTDEQLAVIADFKVLCIAAMVEFG